MRQRALTAKRGQKTSMSHKEEVDILLQTRDEDETLHPVRKLHLVFITQYITSRRTEPRLVHVITQLPSTALTPHAREMETALLKSRAFVLDRLRADRAVIGLASHVRQ
jgi:hypothetical protein